MPVEGWTPASFVTPATEDSMNLWIPTIGDAFILESDWKFHLHHEGRNVLMAEAFGQPFGKSYHNPSPAREVTFVTGTELVVDRIYIRQGADEFDSLTFVVKWAERESLVGERFWAKLNEVNLIQCRATTSGNPIGPFAKSKYKASVKPKDPEADVKAAAKIKSKEELELARRTVLELVNAAHYNSSHKYGAHIMMLASDMAARIRTQRMGRTWGSCHIYTPSDMLRQIGGERLWPCTATRKLPDGSTERDFRFRWYEDSEIRSGGITVTILNGNVTDHRELPV